eukprot:scaffold1439_cov404-Prasinococcus_capsulatus_cf.AAC.22
MPASSSSSSSRQARTPYPSLKLASGPCAHPLCGRRRGAQRRADRPPRRRRAAIRCCRDGCGARRLTARPGSIDPTCRRIGSSHPRPDPARGWERHG